jgi:enoyl-[acyl-carrier protein] reductase II
MMLKTAVCDLLNIAYPVLQGGMAHIATAELVSAVSRSGGLGIIGAGHYEPGWVEAQIRETKARTDRPFGVNLHLSSPRIEEVIALVIREHIPAVTTGAGDPSPVLSRFRDAGILVIPVVNTVEQAVRVEKAGANAVIAEGMESGGLIGSTTTMALIPQVADRVSIPVIAAGGIADGRGLAAALSLGAAGVQMGTRFACSAECIAHTAYKQKIVDADDRATVVTGETLAYPRRALANGLTAAFKALEEAGASPAELAMFDAQRMYPGLVEGDTENGALLAGQIAGLIHDIRPVEEIMKEIVSGAERAIRRLNGYCEEE